MKRVALVTGATSGIGFEIARRLVGDGLEVYATGRDEGTILQLNDEFEHSGLHFIRSDVTVLEDIQAIVADIVSTHGRLSVLVNNAGRSGGAPTSSMSDELWEAILETNLTSAFRVTRECLSVGRLSEGEDGRIISISSTGGKQGVALAAAYCASKSGLIGFTKSLALELAPTGTTVNAVCPGFVETRMAQDIRSNHASFYGVDEGKIKAGFESKIPLGRYVEPEEVAAMVSFLCGRDASSVTAQAINVCGGLGRY